MRDEQTHRRPLEAASHRCPRGSTQPANEAYPFFLNDGVTLYYASNGEGSIGGYDIFITRLNLENNTYLKPENVGMPFNSIYNDYMMAVDEMLNIGWFVSDREQIPGKVTIYLFIPNSSKQTYNLDEIKTDINRWPSSAPSATRGPKVPTIPTCCSS